MNTTLAELRKLDESLAKRGYERLDLIGVGPHSRVFRCRKIETGQDYALKVWDWCDGDVQPPLAMLRFWDRMNAIDTSRGLNLQQCVPIVLKSGKQSCVIMRMKPTSPAEVMKSPVDPNRVRTILISAIRGLLHYHDAHEMMHGEIKPTNLFVDENGEVTFGDSLRIPILNSGAIANREDVMIPNPNEPVWRNVVIGEVPPYPLGKYIAPELINVKFGPVGKWADQYRLGMTIYELAMGDRFDRLFSGVGPEVIDSELGWLRWQGSSAEIPSPHQTLRELDAPVREVLHRLTRKKATDRYHSLRSALDLLEMGTESEPADVGTAVSVPEPGGARKPKGDISVTGRPDSNIDTYGGTTFDPKHTRIDIYDDWPVPPEPWSREWLVEQTKARLTGKRVLLAGLSFVAIFLILASLGPMQSYRQVRILVDPRDARVYLDGKRLLGTAPHELTLTVGTHSIKAIHDECQSYELENVEIPGLVAREHQGDSNAKPESIIHPLTISLKKRVQAFEFLVIGYDGNPLKANVARVVEEAGKEKKIALDSQRRYALPLNTTLKYEVNAPGYEPHTKSLEIVKRDDGQATQIKVELKARLRDVRIKVDPSDSDVIDEKGAFLGTADQPIRLAPRPEHYRLTIRKDGHMGTALQPFRLEPAEQDHVVVAPRLKLEDDSSVLEVVTNPPDLDFEMTRLDIANGPQIVGRGPKWRSESLPKGSKWNIIAKLDRFRAEISVEIKTGANQAEIALEMPKSFELPIGMKFNLIPAGTTYFEAGKRPERLIKFDRPGAARFVQNPYNPREIFMEIYRGPFAPSVVRRFDPVMLGKSRNVPQGRKVALNWGIYVCTTETTLRSWQAVMGDRPKMLFDHNENWPVADISFERATDFLRRLEAAEDFAPGSLRFLTPDEHQFLESRQRADEANSNLLPWSRKLPKPVASLQPDEFGLYDIVGNVAEFTQPSADLGGPRGDQFAGFADKSGQNIVICKGGHYQNSAYGFHPTLLDERKSSSNSPLVGFRVVYDPRSAVDRPATNVRERYAVTARAR